MASIDATRGARPTNRQNSKSSPAIETQRVLQHNPPESRHSQRPSAGLKGADCVEEVGGPTVWDVARNQACVSLFALRPALGRAAGSALPSFGGSGRWQRGGTRPEHQTGLSA